MKTYFPHTLSFEQGEGSIKIIVPELDIQLSSLRNNNDLRSDISEISGDVPDNNTPDISEISPSLLGVWFPHHNTQTEAFSEQFNLELLEESLVYKTVENNDKQEIVNFKVDILSDAISEIVKDTSLGIEKIEKVRKGRKRGRKLGYRSENSNGDDAVCGVCGAVMAAVNGSLMVDR